MFLVTESLGMAITHQRIAAAADTVYGIDSNIYQIKNMVFSYNSGSVAPVKGDWLVGATTAAYCLVTEVVLSTGTWGGGDALGKIYVINVVGTFNGSENMNHLPAATGTPASNILTMTSIVKPSAHKPIEESMAKCAIISISTQSAHVLWNGSAPTTSTSTPANMGQPMAAGTNTTLRDIQDIINFKAINTTAGSNFVANITCYF